MSLEPGQRPKAPNRPQNPFTHVAVMGDLVGSEATTSVARLHEIFNREVKSANKHAAKDIASPLTITLGDEFQGLCTSLYAGLLIVKSLRQKLLLDRVECRFVIGLVTLETPVNADQAWNMMGPGLAGTRSKLDDKRHPNAYRFYLPEENLLQSLFEAVGYSLTMTERGWTPRQHQIVAATLAETGNATELAKELHLAKRTLYKIRQAADLDFYMSQWKTLEAAASILDQKYGFA